MLLNSKIEQERRILHADLNFICSNLTRCAVLHLLMKSKATEHCLSLKEISFRLGKYHRVITHHLEKLQEYGLVEVVKNTEKRRNIWGLNLKNVDFIEEVYSYAVKNFFTPAQLERACNVNKTVR